MLALRDESGSIVPLQSEVLARWHDGSVRWLLADFIARNLASGRRQWHLEQVEEKPSISSAECLVRPDDHAFVIHTGEATLRIGRLVGQPLIQLVSSGQDMRDAATARIRLTDAKGVVHEPRIVRAYCECNGPVRATICMEAEFDGRVQSRLLLRIYTYQQTGLVRLEATLHNYRRARHRGGLWDLGDAGSIYFADLSVAVDLTGSGQPQIRFSEEPGRPFREAEKQQFEIYQESSGGENWRSRNHVNRFGHVSCSFRGYRLRTSKGRETGLRANPIVRLIGTELAITSSISEFWQQFPKAIDVGEGTLRLRLFPAQFADLHEMQGGEQKTHTIWFNVGTTKQPDSVLDWCHQPARVIVPPEWYAESGVFPEMLAGMAGQNDRFDEFLRPVIEGENSLVARREIIDEFGWRNFGDVYADHENAHYTGPKPVISHFNNQFDLLFGGILQYARTGDQRWQELFEPLARHVIDIDIYHTEQDRAAYCGGLFWMTDHYLDASTSTHRTYSKTNRRRGQSYGGGPGNSHNFTTGLLSYYYLTGYPLARDAVVGLANWVMRMDDGNSNILSWIDNAPTGLASCTTESDYHGPGRGAGLSINSLLDAWLLTEDRGYLDKAEQLIRRCIHPADEIASLDLLNAELRWSYPVFLVALARYLRCKVESNELDSAYTYGRAALLHYAAWMVDHERPFLDEREKLQYPTETWAAQEFRKANSLRLAAEHADEPLRNRLLWRATALADRAWDDLVTFPTPHTSRAVAILLTEGTADQFFRSHEPATLPQPSKSKLDFGKPAKFVSQKQNVLRLLKTPWKIPYRVVTALMKLPTRRNEGANPSNTQMKATIKAK